MATVYSPFPDETARRNVAAVLKEAQIRRPEQLYSLLRNFPSLYRLGLDIPQMSSNAIRASDLSFQAVADDLVSQSPEAFAFGADHPPEAPAPVGFVVPMPSEEQLQQRENVQRSAEHRETLDIRPPEGWPVRDQGRRGTCVAHALVACREHLGFELGEQPGLFDLSEQFFFWAIKAKTSDPRPDRDGTWIRFAREALESTGVCPETRWSYDGAPQPGNITQAGPGIPGEETLEEAKRLRHSGAEYASGGSIPQILASLARNRPVAISVPVFTDSLAPAFNNWNSPVGLAYGQVLDPPPTAVVSGGHAVCVTGFIADEEEAHGGYFVIRNSWGRQFGSRAPVSGWFAPEPGYGQISATYLEKYLWEMCVL